MGKLKPTKLEKLRSLQNDVMRYQTKVALAEAELRSLIVDALIEDKMPLNSGGVCLNCGLVRRDVRLPCSCESKGDS